MKPWIRSSLFSLCVVGMALAPFSEAEAALRAYLKINSPTQGDIRGSVTTKGRTGSIKVDAISHEVVSPRNASGLPSGKRRHTPMVITKPVDRSSPLLMTVLTNNELVSSWELSVVEPGPKGERLIYTIKLTNASVASIRLVTDAEGNLAEVVTFTYRKIEWIWNDGGIVAEDDWEVAVSKSKKK